MSRLAPQDAGRPAAASLLLRAVRPRQWLKNVLVAAAPLGAGALGDPGVARATAGAFVAFCLASGGTYLVNDLRDVEADRAHPVKRHRPLAAGQTSPALYASAAAVLLACSLLLAFAVRAALGWTVAAYLAATVAYSLRLKHEPVLELVLLALGFLLRAVAGGAATGVALSSWFLIVAGFGSLFMAAGKRFSELDRLGAAGQADDAAPAGARRALVGYTPTYLRFVWGSAAAVTMSAYCLWAFEVAAEPSSLPWATWSVLPFVLGVLRYAVDIDAGAAETPEDTVLHDRVLLGVGAAWVVLFGLGAWGV